ncbi:multicopper oxidase family protein [Nocardia sp. CNY236]|uniref:multicopper oxidase family protein n=1 Tax=Nocardia sp. CNY236 TaxID=1169152 RepID=UPI0004217A14|nr:multicopper oxidase family protein [Nocardia sp. CNY236]
MSARQIRRLAPISRRGFLALGMGATTAAALAACSAGPSRPRALVEPDSEPVRAAENARRAADARIRPVSLRAAPATVDLGGVQVRTWTYGGDLPGQAIRVDRGDVLRATLSNGLTEPTTVHWHGIALRNDMDGMPGLTQPPVEPGAGFDYEFTVPHAGTYFFHPHVGVQLDRGLYAPLIVEDRADGRDYDIEAVVVLDDWLDGVDGRDPNQQLRQLQAQGMSGMGHGGMQDMHHDGAPSMVVPTHPDTPLGSDAGDIADYPYYLVNGRIEADPVTFAAKPGQRMRLRMINAASDTAFRVAVAGHQLRVTHTDGYPVQPVTTASLLIGMGERYDAIIELGDGVFPLVASAEGKSGQGFALIRTGSGAPPPAAVRPEELSVAPLTADRLTASDSARLDHRAPDTTLDLTLGQHMRDYVWTINGRVFDEHTALDVVEGQRVRLRFINETMMFHPMHLHGHTFQMVTPTGVGPRKDTAIVLPRQTVEVDFHADNPGQWMVHCHNAYHGEAGMMSVLSYVR